MIFWAIFHPFPIENSEEISIADRVVKIKNILEILVATNQDMILFELLTFFWGATNRSRDGNSSENFIPRGIEESRNGKFTFLGDRGR